MKTKVVIFEKKYRTENQQVKKNSFFISGDTIEIVNNLYIILQQMVAFITHKTNTKDTIRRSSFATRRYIDFSQLSLNVLQ